MWVSHVVNYTAEGMNGVEQTMHGLMSRLPQHGVNVEVWNWTSAVKEVQRREIESMCIVDRVSFKGPVNGEAKWTLLRSSYALVHPSRWEGMPFSVLEALAVGCPALITAETNLAEMVQAHATGIVASGLPQDIAQGLQELISMPPERYDAVRHQARKVIEDHYTWDQVTASMAQLYQDVVGGARHT